MTEIGPRDRVLLLQLRAALDEHDPVPESVVDAELAALAEDSALSATGVRSGDASRVLTFECSTGVIVLEVTVMGDTRRVVGQADRPAHLIIRHWAGVTELDTDEHGRFQVEGIAAGPASLRCVFADAPNFPVVTSWVLV